MDHKIYTDRSPPISLNPISEVDITLFLDFLSSWLQNVLLEVGKAVILMLDGERLSKVFGRHMDEPKILTHLDDFVESNRIRRREPHHKLEPVHRETAL
jgi:hypothetical protein